MNRLVILEAKGHGKVIADVARLCGYTEISFLTDIEGITSCLGYPVIGKMNEYVKHKTADFFVALGDAQQRKSWHTRLKEDGCHLATLIHPKSALALGARIGEGTLVAAGSIVGPDVKIGEGCILNTACSVDHDTVVEDFVHVSVGAHVAGYDHIGSMTWIGAGATVSNKISICSNCMIGAGAVVVKNITEEGTYVGVPAKKIR